MLMNRKNTEPPQFGLCFPSRWLAVGIDLSMAKKVQLWVALAAVLLAICDANLTQNETNQFLQAHNEARKEVGVHPLHWSKKLESHASKLASHADSCHLSQKAAPSSYGMNQDVTNSSDSPATVVGLWVNVEVRRYYDYDNNSCAAGHKDECLRYTQVMWNKTAELGCGMGSCSENTYHIICLYDPRGNIHGKKPY